MQVSKDVLRKMIKMLTKEDMSDKSPVNLPRNLLLNKEYLLQLTGKLDDNMIYVDDAMRTATITGLVNRTLESFTVSVKGNMKCTEGEMFVDVVADK